MSMTLASAIEALTRRRSTTSRARSSTSPRVSTSRSTSQRVSCSTRSATRRWPSTNLTSARARSSGTSVHRRSSRGSPAGARRMSFEEEGRAHDRVVPRQRGLVAASGRARVSSSAGAGPAQLGNFLEAALGAGGRAGDCCSPRPGRAGLPRSPGNQRAVLVRGRGGASTGSPARAGRRTAAGRRSGRWGSPPGSQVGSQGSHPIHARQPCARHVEGAPARGVRVGGRPARTRARPARAGLRAAVRGQGARPGGQRGLTLVRSQDGSRHALVQARAESRTGAGARRGARGRARGHGPTRRWTARSTP